MEVLVTDEWPPTKICGTDCVAVTLTALQALGKGGLWNQQLTVLAADLPALGSEGAVQPHAGVSVSAAFELLSVVGVGHLAVEDSWW